jgi:tyrosinase
VPRITDEARAIFQNATDAVRALALGPTGDGEGGIWNTCSHFGGYPEHFVSWHRLYLASFERIVSKVLGDPTFALPYWNYTDPDHPQKRMIPSAFTEAPQGQASNPLFIPDRSTNFQADGLRVDDIRAKASLRNNRYLDTVLSTGETRDGFNSAIDAQPHGQVHMRVGTGGRGMQNIELAARDPIFWVHHANIDRLWESWRHPRANGLSDRDPTDPKWLQRRFDFAAPDGTKFSWTAGQALSMRESLGYTYDRLQDVKLVALAVGVKEPVEPVPVTSLGASPADQAFQIDTKDKPVTITLSPQGGGEAARATLANPSAHFWLVLNVHAMKPTSCVYDVALRLKKADGSGTEDVLVETFNAFGASHRAIAGHKPLNWQTDVTDLVRAGRLDLTGPLDAVISARFDDPIAPITVASARIEAE